MCAPSFKSLARILTRVMIATIAFIYTIMVSVQRSHCNDFKTNEMGASLDYISSHFNIDNFWVFFLFYFFFAADFNGFHLCHDQSDMLYTLT